ncbi:MAG: hypothetical protein QOH74_1315 [Gaiellales bacterium]|jgi:hypothetical protein|nr:hypothetical protein [Gaiellales bacterium]
MRRVMRPALLAAVTAVVSALVGSGKVWGP